MPKMLGVMLSKPASHATAAELAEHYGVSVQTVWAWVHRKLLPAPCGVLWRSRTAVFAVRDLPLPESIPRPKRGFPVGQKRSVPAEPADFSERRAG